MILTTGEKVAMILIIGFVVIGLLLGGYYAYEKYDGPSPSPTPSPSPSPSKPSPPSGVVPSPMSNPESASSQYINAIFYTSGSSPDPCVTGAGLVWHAPSSGDDVHLSKSETHFDISASKGTICKSNDPTQCLGVNTSGTPESGDSVTLKDTNNMSKDRLANFVFNQWNMKTHTGWLDTCKSVDHSPSLNTWCLTNNPTLCVAMNHPYSCGSTPDHHLRVQTTITSSEFEKAIFAADSHGVMSCS